MAISFISALLVSLLAYGLIAWVLLGWGSVLIRLFKITLPASQFTLSQIWPGWALLLVLLQLLNFVMPINWLATTLLAVGGLLAWWINGATLPRISFDRRTLAFCAAILITAIWLATQAMRSTTFADTAGYHLQSVRWYNEYAIVPGLGNVHGRLAFNQSFFAYAAALNFYPYFEHGYVLANGFLFLMLAVEGWHALILQRGEQSVARFATIFMLPFVAGLSLREHPGIVTPDTATAILQMVLWLHLVRMLEAPLPDTPLLEQQTRSRIHVMVILAATAITVKLSNLGFVAGIGLIILLYNWLSRPKTFRQQVGYLLQFLWLPLLFILIWITRGYIYSGYPLYPLTVGALDVDWRIPHQSAELEARAIYLWPRHGSMDDLPSNWISIWASRLSRLWFIYPIAITMLMAVVYTITKWIRHAKGSHTRGDERTSVQGAKPEKPARRLPLLAAIAFPPFVGLLFWWLTAPDPRFVRSLLTILPILMAYMLLKEFEWAGWGTSRWNQALVMLLVNLGIVGAFVLGLPALMQIPTDFFTVPLSELTTYTMPDGLVVYVPDDYACWSAPLPCSPDQTFLTYELRGSTLQEGFRPIAPQ